MRNNFIRSIKLDNQFPLSHEITILIQNIIWLNIFRCILLPFHKRALLCHEMFYSVRLLLWSSVRVLYDFVYYDIIHLKWNWKITQNGQHHTASVLSLGGTHPLHSHLKSNWKFKWILFYNMYTYFI